jgi:hypothetical protein
MPDFISIEVLGQERLTTALSGVARDVEDLRPSFLAVSDEVYSIIRTQYATRGHGRWPANKTSTIERYAAMNRRGFSVINEPMRRTDALFISETTRGGPHGIYIEEPQSLTMGTDLSYGAIHQARDRKQYDFSDDDVERLAKIIQRGLVTKIADRGFDAKPDAGAIPF